MIRCPLCELEMHAVSAAANPGTLIVLDQCQSCGGIWCDRWELFPVDPDEARRIDPLDPSLLQTPAPQGTSRPLYCPRCGDRLKLFRDPYLDAGLELHRCLRCDGIWLKRGEFSRYKELQQKKRGTEPAKEKKIRAWSRAWQNPDSWVTVGTQGMFAYPRSEHELNPAPPSNPFQVILQLLLRLLLG